MEKLLLEHLALGDDALQSLALRRAERVKAHLVDKGQLAAERLFIVSAGGGGEKSSRVELVLK